MRAAIGLPLEELSERSREKFEDCIFETSAALAFDIKHCKDELSALEARKPKFKELEADRSYLCKAIDRWEAHQQQLVNAAPAELVLIMARVIAVRKSASTEENKERAKAPDAPKMKKPFILNEAMAQLVVKRHTGEWLTAPSEKVSKEYLLLIFERVPDHPHRKMRRRLWPDIRRGPKTAKRAG